MEQVVANGRTYFFADSLQTTNPDWFPRRGVARSIFERYDLTRTKDYLYFRGNRKSGYYPIGGGRCTRGAKLALSDEWVTEHQDESDSPPESDYDSSDSDNSVSVEKDMYDKGIMVRTPRAGIPVERVIDGLKATDTVSGLYLVQTYSDTGEPNLWYNATTDMHLSLSRYCKNGGWVVYYFPLPVRLVFKARRQVDKEMRKEGYFISVYSRSREREVMHNGGDHTSRVELIMHRVVEMARNGRLDGNGWRIFCNHLLIFLLFIGLAAFAKYGEQSV